jgi:hypothetical protein
MKNLITIEGKEFELPDELVNKIKEELNKPKKLTYEDICNDLDHKFFREYLNRATCYSLNQLNKLEAINKLMNTAKYLNGENWLRSSELGATKYNIYQELREDKLIVGTHNTIRAASVYFKSEKLAKQAIDILGEETIKLALSTDW